MVISVLSATTSTSSVQKKLRAKKIVLGASISIIIMETSAEAVQAARRGELATCSLLRVRLTPQRRISARAASSRLRHNPLHLFLHRIGRSVPVRRRLVPTGGLS
jgi:hypothetical protein